MADHRSRLAAIVREHEPHIVADWLGLLAKVTRRDAVDRNDVEEHARSFVPLLADAMAADSSGDIDGPAWSKVREMLTSLSAGRARQGWSPSETATFVFSFKQPLFTRLCEAYRTDPDGLARETWTATLLLDKLGLLTTEVSQKSREDIIIRQQRELLELSTPVVTLWEGILGVPLIGTLDSERTQVVMESLLQRIVDSGAAIAIIDITGVPTVDTLVAQHLLKTVSAARLMGAECIISGIRPQIAQTIVHLGVDLGNVATKATLADALVLALSRVGSAVTKAAPRA
ncbi:MAG TPA: STAS domain-containing protein [Methylomirabilota bacterium]|nr:STAS domain-containing protein [Methylomirabilota bacterium]